MTTVTETLYSYVPHLIRRRFAANPARVESPELSVYPGAILFADIHGFTNLAGRYARAGAAGIEQLTSVLNAYFDQLILLIDEHGGDVVKLAGDAVVALWTPETPVEHSEASVSRAAACGLAIQSRLHNYPVAENVTMSVRVAVGAGNALTMCVGGVHDRWELLVAGDPVKQIGEADARAAAGEVVLSPQAWRRLDGLGVATTVADGFMRLTSLHGAAPATGTRDDGLRADVDLIHAFVPAAVRSRLRAGQFDWLADLRRVSVVMVQLVDLGLEALYDLDGQDIASERAIRIAERTQAVFRDLQHALYRHEGSINKITVDDNGVTLVAALGLPPLAHEDNGARAIRAAVGMHRALQAFGMRGSIGVATGLVFCGELGNAIRREYTMNGDTMAMAARLMQAADGGVLCDSATYAAARHRVALQALEPIRMKGMPEPIPVFRPSMEIAAGTAVGSMVGRAAERDRLARHVENLERGIGGLVVITGEPGIGKSRLVTDLLEAASGVTAACGGGDPVEKASPYHPWRAILATLLGLDPSMSTPDRTATVTRSLEEDLQIAPDLLRLLPLLNPILGVDIPDNADTAEMSGQMRADGVNRLLIRVLRALADRRPLLIAIEDGHWIDASSWALARQTHQRVERLFLIITTRPMDSPAAESRWLDDLEEADRIKLGDMTDDELRSLLCQRLGVDSIPDVLENLILSKTHGNPFFAEELVLTLRDRGAIVVADGTCRLSPGIDLQSVDLPDSVQGVITSRIDRLTQPQQLTLKSASVIGRVFPYRILRDVYPIPDEKEALPGCLDTLARLDLTPRDESEADLSYLFKHAITQDVVYQQMLFAQRRQLHRAVAEWYEHTHTDLTPLYPLLAHHWSQAERWSRAVDCLEKAAEAALRSGAYREGVSFLRDAIDLDARIVEPPAAGVAGQSLAPAVMGDVRSGSSAAVDGAGQTASGRTLRRARWERQLGDALLALGRTNESREHLERAASMLGHPVPKGAGNLYIRLLQQAGRQAVGYFSPKVGRVKSDGQKAVESEVARTYERLAEIHYLVNEPELLVHAFLVSGNLARGSGLAPELARAYANIGLAAGMIPLHGVAEAYRRRAHETAAAARQLAAQAWVLEVTSVYDAGIGNWDQAMHNLGDAMDIYERLQDRAHWGECQAMTAEVSYHQGRFARCADIYRQMYERAMKTGNAIEKSWGAIGQAQGLLPLGHYEEAIEFSNATAKIMAETANPDIPVAIDIRGFLALAHLRLGRPDEARKWALEGLEIVRKVSPSAVAAFEGYGGIAETLLSLWEASGASDARRVALDGCGAFHRYAGIFPIAVARDCYYQGRGAWKQGRHRKALAIWRRGVETAARLKMPYDEALNRRMLGLNMPGAEAASHAARAAEIMRQLEISRPEQAAFAGLPRIAQESTLAAGHDPPFVG